MICSFLSDVDLETKKKDEEPAKFYWKQTPEDIEIWFYILPGKVEIKLNIFFYKDKILWWCETEQ